MTPLRELRRAVDLSQQEFAALIDVPLNTFRMWDSGSRPIPPHILRRTQAAATAHMRNDERLSLDQLAREFGVHERTLRAAARTGRLQVTFSSRSAFGRPIRLATRAAVQAFMRKRPSPARRRSACRWSSCDCCLAPRHNPRAELALRVQPIPRDARIRRNREEPPGRFGL